MYDEIDTSLETIKNIKTSVEKIIVIQSNPGNEKNILDKSLIDHFELLPDLASSSKNYKNERQKGGLSTIPARALSRNCSKGFQISTSFEIDWWVFIMGDVLINDLSGIKKIIKKMEKENKFLGITQPIGQTLYDPNGHLTHFVTKKMTTLIPTFFIVHSDLIQKGLFTNIEVTNPYTTEQGFGDDLKKFSEKQNLDFSDLTFFISDVAYPDFIKGLKYNVSIPKTPKFLRSIKNHFKKK